MNTSQRRLASLGVGLRLCIRSFLVLPFFLGGNDTLKAEDSASPLKVFVLSGQSNMQGHAHIRTLDAMAPDPKTAPFLKQIRNEDGTHRVCENVWISSLGTGESEKVGQLTVGFGTEARGPKIGPELMFGMTLEKRLGEPILLIKTSWGGKSLHTDFRPPSAGPYVFNESQVKQFEKQGKDLEVMKRERESVTGVFYRRMIEHIHAVLADIKRVYPDYDEKQGYELAGFVWFQGWNDMVDRGAYPQRDQTGGYDLYSDLLTQFIRDVRQELSAPKLPFVIGVMGVGGPIDKYSPDQKRYAGVHGNFRNAMAAPALRKEFEGTVAAVRTENYWDMDVVALREREKVLKEAKAKIDSEVKAGGLTRAEGKTQVDKLYATEFSPDELVLLKESTSNADFHYMGSARIMTQIGAGFADAMLELLEN